MTQVWPRLPVPPMRLYDPLYRFYTFCHPTVCSFLEALDAQGLSGLLRRDPTRPIQNPAPPNPEFFNARYQSNPFVVDNAVGHLPNPGENSPPSIPSVKTIRTCSISASAPLP